MQLAFKPLIPVVGHTLVIYLFLIGCLRLLGRRQMGQMTVIDLVVIIILGSAVETSMVARNTSLPAGLASAGTLLIANRLLTAMMRRFRRLAHWIAGGPVLVVSGGRFIDDHLRRLGLTEADVLEGIRERGFAHVQDVKYAVYEADGQITAIPSDSGKPGREKAIATEPSGEAEKPSAGPGTRHGGAPKKGRRRPTP